MLQGRCRSEDWHSQFNPAAAVAARLRLRSAIDSRITSGMRRSRRKPFPRSRLSRSDDADSDRERGQVFFGFGNDRVHEKAGGDAEGHQMTVVVPDAEAPLQRQMSHLQILYLYLPRKERRIRAEITSVQTLGDPSENWSGAPLPGGIRFHT